MYSFYCCKIKLLFCFLSLSQVEARKPLLRIIGGRDVYPGELAYVVRLQALEKLKVDNIIVSKSKSTRCTGSALSRTAVLTAAHCCGHFSSQTVDDVNVERTFVARYSSGDGTPTASDVKVDVLRCILPPSARLIQDTSIIADDIALLETQPAPIRTFAKISGLDYRSAFGQQVLLMGYGLTNQSDGTLNGTLELLKPLQVVDALWTRCDLAHVYPIVCAVKTCDRHIAACGGDSGGPVVHASGILGINSYATASQNCQVNSERFSNDAVVYIVPIGHYLHWISDEVTKMNSQYQTLPR